MGPTDRFCPIKFVPFRGVNCSDAAGHEIEYHLIQDILDDNESLTGRMWDDSVSSPWYNYKAAGALSCTERPCWLFMCLGDLFCRCCQQCISIWIDN
eukprot:COSAG02_NODE_1805_length_10872_cov_7.969461_13_plen_97_part_00